MIKNKDLIQGFKSATVVEYTTPAGTRWRYERDFSRVGLWDISGFYVWHHLDKNDLSSAKSKIVQIHNQEYL